MKKINFELIEDTESEPYKIMAKMRKFHPDIDGAKIAIAWQMRLKADKDGHLILGKCVKASDLQREFVDYDFVILLNREVWDDSEFTPEKKAALVDHELCHAAVSINDDGVCYDERGRGVFRVRKHDIEEFHAIVIRHGCYKRDLELFAENLLKKRRTPLLNDTEETRVSLRTGDGETIFEGTSDEFSAAARRVSETAKRAARPRTN